MVCTCGTTGEQFCKSLARWVDLVHLVYFVYLIRLVQPYKRDESNNGWSSMLADVFSNLLACPKKSLLDTHSLNESLLQPVENQMCSLHD
jgi:hypothetical protein